MPRYGKGSIGTSLNVIIRVPKWARQQRAKTKKKKHRPLRVRGRLLTRRDKELVEENRRLHELQKGS